MLKKNKFDIIDIPELNIDNKLIPMYLVGALIGTDKGLDKKIFYIRISIVRLIDKAVYEYSKARNAMIEDQLEPLRSTREMQRDGRIIYTHIIVNHLENCINSISRFFKLYDKLKSIHPGPIIDRELRRKAENYKDNIRDIRNIIEHIDEDIQNDQIQQGQATALMVSSNFSDIKILDQGITLQELVDVVHYIYQIGKEISQYNVNGL